MMLKFGVMVPQGWHMDLVGIPDPIEAYETMTHVAQEAALASLSEQQRSLVSMMQASSLIGTPESMRNRIAEYEEAGVQEPILWFPDAAKLESLRLFAREFIQR
jgi:alkanesulfonate monooxygenase SsuD/methylene tetrahydromethanopterin reductase-like flavin-dependent oxidoreductase (luciferase family)